MYEVKARASPYIALFLNVKEQLLLITSSQIISKVSDLYYFSNSCRYYSTAPAKIRELLR